MIALVQSGHLEPPDPDGPGLFSMASVERTRALLDAAGFAQVRTEEIPVTFEIPDIDEYLAFIADAAGSIAFAVRGLSDADREAIKAQVETAFERFAGRGGYEIPGTVLCAVAS